MGYSTLGEIRLFAGTFAPMDWEFCNGQMLPISENTALFARIGTTFGGDGVKTFALPDLRGRVPIHQGLGTAVGDAGGTETVSLTEAQLPGHTHSVAAAGTATTPKPQGGYCAQNGPGNTAPYSTTQDGSLMAASAVTIAGAGAPHENMQPFLALNYIVCTTDEGSTMPFIGEVRAFAGQLPPGGGWVPCNGALLPLRSNMSLATLIGTTFGGDLKQETIGVPNLMDRVAVGVGQGPNLTKRNLADTGGVDSVTLVGNQLAAHSHPASCRSAAGDAYGPSGAYWAADAGGGSNYDPTGSDKMAAGVFGATGGDGAHENRQPFVAVNFAIAASGVYPNRP